MLVPIALIVLYLSQHLLWVALVSVALLLLALVAGRAAMTLGLDRPRERLRVRHVGDFAFGRRHLPWLAAGCRVKLGGRGRPRVDRVRQSCLPDPDRVLGPVDDIGRAEREQPVPVRADTRDGLADREASRRVLPARAT